LNWWASSQGWPAQGYRVYIDKVLSGTSATTSFTPVSALGEGTHSWRVESFDRAGQVVSSALGELRIDTTIPILVVKLKGSGKAVTVSGVATDAKPPKGSGLASVKVNFGDGSPSVATDAKPPKGSGLASVKVNFGDGSPSVVGKSSLFNLKHSFVRFGRLTVTVTATDGAGNKAVFLGKVKAN